MKTTTFKKTALTLSAGFIALGVLTGCTATPPEPKAPQGEVEVKTPADDSLKTSEQANGFDAKIVSEVWLDDYTRLRTLEVEQTGGAWVTCLEEWHQSYGSITLDCNWEAFNVPR